MPRIPDLRLPTDSVGVQAEKKAAWNELRSAPADFYTVGYMGRSAEQFLEILQQAGVWTVVDIRHTAVSMYKPAFSKRNLDAGLAAVGIGYLHLAWLGVPRDIRGRASGAPSRDPIWDWYDTNVIPSVRLHDVLNWADHPIAFLCTELDPTSCHRHRLALALERHGLRGFDL